MTTDALERAWPDIAIPPGELLGEELEARGMSQQDLARRMGRPAQMVNELIHGKKALTPETALGLEKVLGIPASFWTNSESSYQLVRSRIGERERLEREAETWLPEFPVAEAVRRGLLAVKPRARPWEKAHALLQFLGYGSFAQWEAQTATAAGLRVTDPKRASRGALALWLREGENDGHEQAAEPYDEARFREALKALRAYTTSGPEVFPEQMRERCAEAGVAVSFIREYPKANATGAARWLQPDKGHIQLSLRHKTADVLWFTFYHEARAPARRALQGRAHRRDARDRAGRRRGGRLRRLRPRHAHPRRRLGRIHRHGALLPARRPRVRGGVGHPSGHRRRAAPARAPHPLQQPQPPEDAVEVGPRLGPPPHEHADARDGGQGEGAQLHQVDCVEAALRQQCR